ncbi:hypothetical protein Tco_0750916 [Tanacetum coccineum]|uniref:Uncharacterized protein n=1 Tax=Tanacetum coccineum TaxID=301880 RepID=A0ABQ4Z2T8_9ASTR
MSETEPIPPTSSVTALRIPIIKKGEYDLWSMKMRQYIAITDHILWDIITNGNQTTTDPASPSVSAPKTSLAANARRNNEKALNILLSAIPDRHLLSFHDAGVSNSNSQTLLICPMKSRAVLMKQSTAEPHIPKRIYSSYLEQASMRHNSLWMKNCWQIDEDAMEEIDIRWQVAMMYTRIRKFMRKTGDP